MRTKRDVKLREKKRDERGQNRKRESRKADLNLKSLFILLVTSFFLTIDPREREGKGSENVYLVKRCYCVLLFLLSLWLLWFLLLLWLYVVIFEREGGNCFSSGAYFVVYKANKNNFLGAAPKQRGNHRISYLA